MRIMGGYATEHQNRTSEYVIKHLIRFISFHLCKSADQTKRSAALMSAAQY